MRCIALAGANLPGNCTVVSAFVGSFPLALSTCNQSTIVAQTTAGYGVAGAVTVFAFGRNAVITASTTFAYIAPQISSVVIDAVCYSTTTKYYLPALRSSV